MLLKVGGRVKVEIFLSDPPMVFVTTVRAIDQNRIELAAPAAKGRKIGVDPGIRVVVSQPTATGLIIIDTVTLKTENLPVVTWVLRVPPIQNIRKIQRRREDRYAVDVHVNSRIPSRSKNDVLLHLININSIGGLISLESPQLEVGDRVTLDLTPLVRVSGTAIDHRMIVNSHVVRSVGDQGKVFGVKFDPLERSDRANLLEALRRLKSERI